MSRCRLSFKGGPLATPSIARFFACSVEDVMRFIGMAVHVLRFYA
jgi:hypothetical protein